jgi:hypothetical protein
MTRGNNMGFGSAAVWLFYAGGEFLKFIQNLTESFLYVHVTAYRNKFIFNKTNSRTNFPNLFVKKLYMYRAVPLLIIRSFPLYIRHWCHQIYMTYTSAECTVETPGNGQRNCPKHVEFRDKINLGN